MAFYGMRFGESSIRHPPMKERGVDSRFYGAHRSQGARRDPMDASSFVPNREQRPQELVYPSSLPQQQNGSPSGFVPNAPFATTGAPVNVAQGLVPPQGVAPEKVTKLSVPTSQEAISLFKRFDYNGNNKLSLAELDRAVAEIWPHYNNKPALMRAYKSCDVDGDGYVTSQEFPLFVKYLARFNELWVAFASIDRNGDRRISLEEFVRGRSVFGLSHRTTHEVQQLYNAIDRNRGGFILFDELASYIAGTELNAERQLLKTQLKRPVPRSVAAPAEFLELPSLPREQDLFSRLDVNRNGMLSLAELDKAVVELWPRFNNKPALMRAYKAADMNGNGYLGRREFKLFLTFIVVYTNLYQQFSLLDLNGDRRLSLNEFLAAKTNAGRSESELRSIFASLDSNRGGYILFDEYCEFEGKRTLEHLLRTNPSAGAASVHASERPCIPGLLCVYCNRPVPELDLHLPICRAEHLKAVQNLPEFLHISLPDMPLPIPTLQSQVKLYNETASRIHAGLGIVECSECGRKFPLLKFAGHLKTHSISYDRRMQLMRQPGKTVADVALPSGVERADKSEAIRELRRSLLNGFDTSSIALLRRLLFLQSKQSPNMSAQQLQKLLCQCGLVGNRTCPLATCCVLLGTFDSAETGSAAAVLSAIEVPLSQPRQRVMEQCYAELDTDGGRSIPYRVLRDNLLNRDLLGPLSRPVERVVPFREFEQLAKDLSPLFAADDAFFSLFELSRKDSAAGGNSFNVIATLSSGQKQVIRIDVAPGSVVRTDPKSLLRRLTLLGVEDAVKVELM